MTELEKAVAAYPKATQKEKTLLESIFGAAPLQPKITDQVKTFEEAHVIFLTMKFKDKLYTLLQKRLVKELSAFDKLLIIARVLQQDWKADWSNTNQYKYYPWFQFNKAKTGFGFSGTGYDYDRTFSGVGSRLCFPSDELAEYFGTQFLELHNEYLIINH